MDWFKKHVDTVVVLGGILSSVIWMNHKFTQVDEKFAKVDLRFSEVEKELSVIKTVLILKQIMPAELAATTVPFIPEK